MGKMKITWDINGLQLVGVVIGLVGLIITLGALIVAYENLKLNAATTLAKIDWFVKIQKESIEKQDGRMTDLFTTLDAIQSEPVRKEIQRAATKVTILEPANDVHVGHSVPMKGTVIGMPPGTELWVVKEVGDSFHPDRGPITVTGNQWEGTAHVGSAEGDSGKFTIHIVQARPETGEIYNKYLSHAAAEHWRGLETLSGGVIVGTVTVIRDK